MRQQERREQQTDIEESLIVHVEGVEIMHHEQRVVARAPERQPPPTYWPEGEPLPGAYLRPRPVPCGRCRRLLLDDGRQAVVLLSIPRGGVAYLRCRACGERWALPVE